MVIVFIGPPGSGKGTQAQVLKDSVLPNLHILTVSSLLKEKSSDGSVLGNEIKQKMDNGDLIEDSIVISVLKEKKDSEKSLFMYSIFYLSILFASICLDKFISNFMIG